MTPTTQIRRNSKGASFFLASSLPVSLVLHFRGAAGVIMDDRNGRSQTDHLYWWVARLVADILRTGTFSIVERLCDQFRNDSDLHRNCLKAVHGKKTRVSVRTDNTVYSGFARQIDRLLCKNGESVNRLFTAAMYLAIVSRRDPDFLVGAEDS